MALTTVQSTSWHKYLLNFTFDVGIERSIPVSNVRYHYRMFDTGIERSIPVSNVRHRYRTFDNVRYWNRTFDIPMTRGLGMRSIPMTNIVSWTRSFLKITSGNVEKRFQNPENLKIFRKRSNASKCFRMRPNASQWVRMDPKASKNSRKP